MFALLAVAGELARRYGIVPWQNDYEVIKACVTLFDRWRE
jgi:hypothetical protein